MFDMTKTKLRKRIIKWSVILSLILIFYIYHVLQPAIIFHSPKDNGYLGKVVCTYSGDLDKLYITDSISTYRIPYTWNWSENDEIAIFMRNYDNLFKKKDIDFWRLDVYLDENGRYKSHAVRKYFWQNL